MSLIQSLLLTSKITKVGAYVSKAKLSFLENACLWNLLFDKI